METSFDETGFLPPIPIYTFSQTVTVTVIDARRDIPVGVYEMGNVGGRGISQEQRDSVVKGVRKVIVGDER